MAFKLGRWDLDADVVCVGSGLGGLSAAILAHDQGRKAIVLEKAPKLGGVCAYSGGEVFVPANHLEAAAGIDDSLAKGRAYFEFLAAGYAEPALQTLLLEVGPVAARYFGDKAGVRWKIVKDFPDYHYPKAPGTVAAGRYLEVELFDGNTLGEWQKKTYLSPHMPNGITHDELFAWGGFPGLLKWDFQLMGKRMHKDLRGFGPGMMAYFVKAAMLDRKIPAHVGTTVRELVLDDGVVVGVRAEQNGKSLMVRARRGVVLAVGGYDWHPELPKFYEQLPKWGSMVQPSVEGDGMMLGGELGAQIAAVPGNNLGLFYGYEIPGEEHDGRPLLRGSWEGGFPHSLWVNRAGQRFADESFYRDYLPKTRAWDGVKQTQPNFPPFLIFDSQCREKYPLGTFLPGQPLPDWIKRADTLQELGAQLGVDGVALQATVARFNPMAAAGVDSDFDRGTYPWAAMMTGDRTRPNPNLGPLDKPPYYGLELRVVSAGINCAGLRTNEHGQVMHVRGRPISGLYAVGNAAAPLDIGAGYQSGLSNLRGMVFGYLAGKHAASR
ncbi:MAG: FAD-binding protein [Deltaproteobacteria bacterium]|nr:FAD-binding protein [Deltaproteobacteria bacterium]